LKPKGVLIDFGDTLSYIDREGSMKYTKALFSILREYGYQGNLGSFASAFDDVIGNSTKGEWKNLREFWNVLLENLGVHSKLKALIEELENARSLYSTVVFKLYSGAHRVLEVLQKKYRLALVSNCAIGTYEVVEDLGLTEYFDCVTLSYKVGVRKPDRRIYVEALKCLGLEPHESIFVADEISDLEGAKDVGMRTLLVRQGEHTTHEARDPNFKPDFQCNHVSEILKFL
jgi:HAD superfamily hydrolase (TIGR01509 family)